MNSQVSERLLDAIESGDKVAMRKLYWPDARIWHNTDGVTRGVAESLPAVEDLIDNFSPVRFEHRRTEEFPGGVIQQFRMTAGRSDSGRIVVDACMVLRVEDGRITQLEEYFDSAALAPLYPTPDAADQ